MSTRKRKAVSSEEPAQKRRRGHTKSASVSQEEQVKTCQDPISSASWKPNDNVPYKALTSLYAKIESEQRRLQMTEWVSDFLQSVLACTPGQFISCVYLLCGQVRPEHEGKELGIGDQLLIKTLASVAGEEKTTKQAIAQYGDLGLYTQSIYSSWQTQTMSPLSCEEVYQTFRNITNMSGRHSQAEKITTVGNLLRRCTSGDEAKYIVRSLQGNLRIGLAEKTILAAVARAMTLTAPGGETKAATPALRKQIAQNQKYLMQAYSELPSHDVILSVLLHKRVPFEKLAEQCHIAPGIPIKVMLGRPTKGVREILTRFEGKRFTIEWKYDGERAQIHFCEDGRILIYSRNGEDHTGKYPDIVAFIRGAFDPSQTKSFILDCEVVAWDKNTHRIQSFQTLSTRRRKHASEEAHLDPVAIFAFDLLYWNGTSYLSSPFAERRAMMHQYIHPIPDQFQFVHSLDTRNPEDIQDFLQAAVAGSCEGLMVKTLYDDASYIPGKKGWLKVKKDYLEGCGDTLDLVPIGAWYGKGRRTGVYGSFLLGCYDEYKKTYESVCKVGTGFSDEDLCHLERELQTKLCVSCHPQVDCGDLKPDVYFTPSFVWEVKCADLSMSPLHMAAYGVLQSDKGIALRFPRFLRSRPDKGVTEATSVFHIVEMFRNQSVQR